MGDFWIIGDFQIMGDFWIIIIYGWFLNYGWLLWIQHKRDEEEQQQQQEDQLGFNWIHKLQISMHLIQVKCHISPPEFPW